MQGFGFRVELGLMAHDGWFRVQGLGWAEKDAGFGA